MMLVGELQSAYNALYVDNGLPFHKYRGLVACHWGLLYWIAACAGSVISFWTYTLHCTQLTSERHGPTGSGAGCKRQRPGTIKTMTTIRQVATKYEFYSAHLFNVGK